MECSVGEQRWVLDENSVLGSGGFASVYAAMSQRGRRAAIKVVDTRLQSEWAQSKLQREADTLRAAEGGGPTHVVEFFGEARVGPYHYFVMEPCGPDLLTRVLAQRGIGEDDARSVLCQVLRALVWLHNKRICHGDIKPENILCDRQGSLADVKLADFGSAVELPAEGYAEADPVAQGTTLYSPPEVLEGRPYSTKADLWSTGITAYILISGFFPFATPEDALTNVASFDGDAWRDVSPAAGGFIQSLLRHDPEARPVASEALQHPWLRPELCSTPAPAPAAEPIPDQPPVLALPDSAASARLPLDKMRTPTKRYLQRHMREAEAPALPPPICLPAAVVAAAWLRTSPCGSDSGSSSGGDEAADAEQAHPAKRARCSLRAVTSVLPSCVVRAAAAVEHEAHLARTRAAVGAMAYLRPPAPFNLMDRA